MSKKEIAATPTPEELERQADAFLEEAEHQPVKKDKATLISDLV